MERTKPATASVILVRLTIPSKINRLSAKSKSNDDRLREPPVFPSTEASRDFWVYVYFRNVLMLAPFSHICQAFFEFRSNARGSGKRFRRFLLFPSRDHIP